MNAKSLASALPIDRVPQLVPMRCKMPFLNQGKLKALVEEYIRQTPAEQHEKLMRFLCTSPLDDLGAIKERREWKEESVPSSLSHTIRTPLENFIFLIDSFLKSVDPAFFKSVWDYLENPHAPKQFNGVALILDQSSSTQQQQGLDPQTINKTLSVMHSYFLASMATYRLFKDALVGDAISLVGKAPEDNTQLVAYEAARFLLTAKAFFSIHDRLTGMSPEARRSTIKIRGAMSVGEIGLSDNPIQATAACPLMNQTSRFAGFPPEMTVVTNPDGAKYLKRFFDLTPMKVGGELLSEIDALSKTADQLNSKKFADFEAGELFAAYEAVCRRMSLFEIIHKAFERPNLPDDFLRKRGEYEKKEELAKFTKYLEKAEADAKMLEGLKHTLYKYGSAGEDASDKIVEIERRVKFDLERQPYVNYVKGKFKGLTLGEMDVLYTIDGYKKFAGDSLATPEGSLFQKLFLQEKSKDGKSRIEEFVERTGLKYGFPARTNYNLLAPYYLMYTIQLSGSPDFAFQTACRAAGMAAYAVEKLQQNWGRQPDTFLAEAQKKLAEKGVFNEKGEVQEKAFVEYLEKSVVLPALVNEIGLLRIFDEVNKADCAPNAMQTSERDKIEATASWLAKHFGDFQGTREEEARDLIKSLGRVSAGMLDELNKEFPGAVPLESIEVVKRIRFENKNHRAGKETENEKLGETTGPLKKGDADEPLPADLEFARNIIMASRAVQAMRKLKAHKQKQKMKALPWETIQAELQKIELQPFVHGLYYELFLEKPA